MVDRWERNIERRPMSTGMAAAVLIIVFVLLVGAVLWALGVFTSPVRSAGDAFAQKNSAANMIRSQYKFQADYNDYKTKLVQIKDAQTKLKNDTAFPAPTDAGSSFARGQMLNNDGQAVQGFTQFCQSDAADYNTAARAYLEQDFRDADLPYQLDPAACSAAAAG